MKYIISESRISKIVFDYLDNKNFYRLEYDNYIYLLDTKIDDYAKVKYDIYNGWCTIEYDLIVEIKNLFSLTFEYSFTLVSEWTKNKIGKFVDSYDVDHKIIIV